MENQNFERFRAGLALVETARNTADIESAKKIAKEGFALIQKASATFMDIPDDWCGTGPKPWPWPWGEKGPFGPGPDPIPDFLSREEVFGRLASIKKNIRHLSN